MGEKKHKVKTVSQDFTTVFSTWLRCHGMIHYVSTRARFISGSVVAGGTAFAKAAVVVLALETFVAVSK